MKKHKNLKIAAIFTFLVINFSLLAFVYFQLQQVKAQLITMENIGNSLGSTLNSCAVIPEAYNQFKPSGGYETRLMQCANAYKELTKTTNRK